MAVKTNKKRTAQPIQRLSKKRKLAGESQTSNTKSKGKERAYDKPTIPIPTLGDEEDIELSEDDIDMLEEYGGAVSFLQTLDEKGIARSKKETERLHQMNKPVRKQAEDDLPSINSGSEAEEDGEEQEWTSSISEDASSDDQVEYSNTGAHHMRRWKRPDSDEEELPYESQSNRRQPGWEPEPDEDKGIERLPIKLADGRIQKSGSKVVLDASEDSGLDSDDGSAAAPEEDVFTRVRFEDVSTGARFGRAAVADVIGQKSRKARIQGAKEQIAGICQEILGDPENSLGLLRRLHTFSLPQISTPTHAEPVQNDDVIRRLTFLSELAVFKDIIPGYRIRTLTDKEKAEKVSQMVQRTRDWEQGLVGIYQTYLRSLEAELKAKSELAETALHCMCTLLVEVTHFNFRVNLMSSIVAALSRKSWDKSSDLCLDTLIKVFRADNTGEVALEIVRLLNRMIKERKYNVHPEVLTCLLHLRLKSELGVRASETKSDKNDAGSRKTFSKGRAAARRAKGKTVDQPHLSKKAKKMHKERKEIEKEMHEAAAEVDKDERAARHTETLKLLFVLYFSVLKAPKATPLLPAALRGIARFAHLVNIDFFKDLLQVLKTLMTRDEGLDVNTNGETSEQPASSGPLASSGPGTSNIATVQHQLLCVVTAFELLSGQGEALDIDLSDFINRLYAALPTLALLPDIEAVPASSRSPSSVRGLPPPFSLADTLFRALTLAFAPRSSSAAAAPPSWRSAAFSKRLLSAALHWPPATAARAITFVGALVERDPKLEALLSTEDRAGNGVYRPDVDDPQVCNAFGFGSAFWELRALAAGHYAEQVRVAAGRLLEAGRLTS